MRRSRHHTQKKENHGRITDAVSIRERPAAAKDRAVPGHWEGDLLCGSRNSQIATLVERHTRYVMMVKLDGKDSETVISALIENARNLPQELQVLCWHNVSMSPGGSTAAQGSHGPSHCRALRSLAASSQGGPEARGK